MELIKNLRTASGISYDIDSGGFAEGIKQYMDREYTIGPIPDFLKGATFIRTAGNDKMHEEDEFCLSFEAACDVTVYIMHGNTFTIRPAWLEEFTDTGVDIFRPLADDPRNMSFRLFAKKFAPGTITLYGDLPKGFLTPPFRNTGGAGYCMYSVIVQAAGIEEK